MSLTTAMSDDDELNAVSKEMSGNSPYRVGDKRLTSAQQPGGSTAASFNCTGAVRKAGFLSVKKWLLRKKHQVKTN